jgi:hypothetical protein
MAITLYDATVPCYLQGLGALRTVLDKGLEHARAFGRDPDTLAEARLIEDMRPLWFQVARTVDHSAGALRDVKAGRFTRPKVEPTDYQTLVAMVEEAQATVAAWTSDQVNALEGGEMLFDAGGSPMAFTAENYFFSFALPNFHFHAVTAYDILRAEGVPIGKRDYLGQLRLKS